jgi:sulfotransferase famil protein
LISKFDNCLFVHIPKVAGQSIETVFLERAGLNWQQRESMLLRANADSKLGPPRLAHLTAQEYVTLQYLTLNEFNAMFSFTFVRNPWDRLVSEYVYRKYPYSFKDFLFKFFPKPTDDDFSKGQDFYRHIAPQADFICDEENNLLVDFVGRFENLAEDFAKVTKLITGNSLVLPHKNKSPRKKLQKLLGFSANEKQQYGQFYDDESQEFVANLYERDIELFNYDFVELRT